MIPDYRDADESRRRDALTKLAMPAEWSPHERCWMAWPCRPESWPRGIELAWRAYASVAQAIARFEPVTMLARAPDLDGARQHLGDTVDVVPCPLDDSWMRDIGPIFVTDRAGDIAGVDWGFNGWGLVHRGFSEDARVARRVLERADVRRLVGPQILEGGSIHVDGDGTLLTTEQCLLDPERNPHLTRQDIESHLKVWFGCDAVIWLGQGLTNDETRGHVDNLACFSAPGEVLVPSTTDEADPDFAILRDARRRLETCRDARGRRLRIRTLPCPPRVRAPSGQLLPLSYVNAYLANGAVIMPGFDEATDREAAAVYADAFPDREVVVVPGHDIALGGGNIHCITMQQPVRPASL